jgi:hypothetical protein
MTSDSAETAHLRWVIEKQPSCLMRVALDGTLLAVSDAALGLLGARELTQVLDTTLTERLPREAAGLWAEFAARVSNSGSGSAECEMIDLSGVRRSVTMIGVALPNHPDGVNSLLITVRDVSTARRLEMSLQEQENLRQSIKQLTADLAAARERDVKRQRMFAELVDGRVKAEERLAEMRKELERVKGDHPDAAR